MVDSHVTFQAFNAAHLLSETTFVLCLTRKGRGFASYSNKWRPSTLKSLNQTWSQCLLAPGTWVKTFTHSVQFEFIIDKYNETKTKLSIISQEMLVLPTISTPGFSVRARGRHGMTRRITSHMIFMLLGLKRILWVRGNWQTQWKVY